LYEDVGGWSEVAKVLMGHSLELGSSVIRGPILLNVLLIDQTTVPRDGH